MKASFPFAKKCFSLLCAIFLIGAQLALSRALPLEAAARGTPEAPVIWDISTGPLVVSENGTYLVAGQAAEGAAGITVLAGVNCEIILRGAAIDGSALTRNAASPIAVEPGAHLTLRLEEANRLDAPAGCAAIHLPEGASLDIHGPGSLTATGGGGGAGIGGGQGEASGLVGIYSGTVTATGAVGGAGIGGGMGGSAGRVVICGGTVIASGGAGGAGIGGGAGGASTSVELYGGAVTAAGGVGSDSFGGGAGIGGGSGADGGAFYLYGAFLTATGGSADPGEGGFGGGGAGIGGGGGAPGGGFGGSAGEAALYIGPAAVSITGGPALSGGGGGGAGIGGGGCAGPGAMGGLGHAVRLGEANGGTLEVAPGEAGGTGAPGAAYGDGGSGSVESTARAVKPENVAAPENPRIEEIYLGGTLCHYEIAGDTYVANLQIPESALAGVQLSVVSSPGCTAELDGEPLVNGVSLLDFSAEEPVSLTLRAGGETITFSVLALATGQTYDIPHLNTPAQAVSEPDGQDAAQPLDTDTPVQLPVLLGAGLGGLLVAAILVGVALSRTRGPSPDE